jgi:DNA repair photolyase
MAAQGASLESKRRVEYIQMDARSYLTRCDSPRVPFRWTLNSYRGCEFGCKYCYARYTHEFMELHDPQQFEKRIFVKNLNPGRFLEELRKLPVGETLAIGTATDPYQPAERRFGVTRRMLEVIARADGLRVSLVTKSDLVARDADVLAEVARRHYLTVNLTITTVDAALARLLEPFTPRPDLRLRAVRALSAAGIHVTVFCAPVLPLINDSEAALDAVARAAAEVGASGFGAGVVFLKPCAQNVFFPFLEERFPELAPRYRERFARSAYLRGAYPELIRERVARVRSRHGLLHREPLQPELWPRAAQLDLFV